jgi:arylsulfatase
MNTVSGFCRKMAGTFVAAIMSASGPAMAQEVLPFPTLPMGGKAGPTLQDSVHQWREEPSYLPADGLTF